MSRAFGITIDCADPPALARFWVEALGYRLGDGADDDGAMIEDPEGARPVVFFQKVPEGKAAKNRMHLDVEVRGEGTDDEQRARIDAEAARLKALGASDHRGVHADGDAYWIRMNDPEGNEFCLV